MRRMIILAVFLVLVFSSFLVFAKESVNPDSPKGPPDCINCKVVKLQNNVSTN